MTNEQDIRRSEVYFGSTPAGNEASVDADQQACILAGKSYFAHRDRPRSLVYDAGYTHVACKVSDLIGDIP